MDQNSWCNIHYSRGTTTFCTYCVHVLCSSGVSSRCVTLWTPMPSLTSPSTVVPPRNNRCGMMLRHMLHSRETGGPPLTRLSARCVCLCACMRAGGLARVGCTYVYLEMHLHHLNPHRHCLLSATLSTSSSSMLLCTVFPSCTLLYACIELSHVVLPCRFLCSREEEP